MQRSSAGPRIKALVLLVGFLSACREDGPARVDMARLRRDDEPAQWLAMASFADVLTPGDVRAVQAYLWREQRALRQSEQRSRRGSP